MKKETTANKLAALLGLTDKVAIPEHFKDKTKPEKKKTTSAHIGISEDKIQDFRAAQGLVYFLQAPELFKLKTCKHCGEQFLVSRMYVAFCSYTCIEKSLEEMGIKWRKGSDLEALVSDPEVYEGNEPIWIKNIDRIKAVLGVGTDEELSGSEQLSPSPVSV
jgi:hypothetical protein